MITGLFALLLNSAFIFLCAALFTAYIRWRQGVFDLLLLILSWTCFSSFYTLILGLIGILEPVAVTGISCVGAGLIWMIFKSKLRLMFEHFRGSIFGLSRIIAARKTMALALCIMAGLLIARMWIHILAWPPYIWDTLTYHLPRVADWIQNESLVMIDSPIERTYWPATFELLQTWFVLFFHHDFIIEAAGAVYYLIAVLSVYATCRSFEIRRVFALYLALIFAATPSVVLHSVCAKNDIGVAAVYLFVVATILDYRKYRDFLIQRILIIFLSISMAIGIKAYIVFIFPGLLLLGIWILAEKQLDVKKVVQQRPESLLLSTVFILTISISLGGYWYIRNRILMGNPFYPVQFELFDRIIYPGFGNFQAGSFSLQAMSDNILNLLYIRIFDTDLYNPDLPNMAGWGWFSFSIGWTSFIACIFVSSTFRWVAAGFVTSLALLLGWVNVDPWYMRFALWFPAVFIYSYGILVKKMSFMGIKSGFLILSIACVVMNFLGTMSHGYADYERWKQFTKIPLFDRSSACCGTHYSYVRIQSKVPKGEPIGYYTGGNGTIYSLYGSDYSHRVHYLNLSRIKSPIKEMDRLGLRYIYVEATTEIQKKLDELVDGKQLIEMFDNVYRRATDGK